uniref:ABC transporter permease n=1 Tax=Thermosporothrix sp. COM3 TaxID=2490863 RepID=A0A455SFV6_9CHLR|nr:ABC transporter permease [Thermosporothrix sp. COM3]
MDVLLRVLTSGDLWQATLQFGALLLLPALGGVISERSGVVNIAMEGMMLTGAYAAVMMTLATQNVLIGVISAMIAGGLMALIHAVASINFKANQIVSGIAINIGALGLTNYLLIVQTAGQGVPGLPASLRLPSVGGLPLVLQQNVIFYMAILVLIGMHFLLFRTNIGLRIRAVGENPEAADTAGIHVRAIRYSCVIAGGMLSGLAGSFLSLGIAGVFNANMTAGAGFIALAAMIFGKYTPVGTAIACLIFGLGQALSVRLQDTGMSPNLLNMLPYILTIVALVGLVGRTTPPAASGVPYEPGSE